MLGSSLEPHAALLMPLSGPTGSAVILHGFTRSAIKADLTIYSYVVTVSG